MLSPEDNPGIFYFLVGMVVIVMTAVGLSLMVDKRSKFSTGVSEARGDISLQTEEISDLTARCSAMSAMLAEEQAKREPQASGQQQTAETTVTAARRKSELLGMKSTLLEELPALEKSFADYRAKYRRRTWDKAVGQDIGNLTLKDGRQYRQAAITKVTDVGLEIRHEHGFARIQAPDLDQSWQDRFQWDDEERRARLKEESDSLNPVAADTGEDGSVQPDDEDGDVVPPKRNSSRKGDDSPEEENLKRLRTLYLGWKSKVSRLQSEHSEAAVHASYGNQSVPGSLETWKAKAARMRKEVARAQSECAQAKARLASAAPNDPLLRMRDDEHP